MPDYRTQTVIGMGAAGPLHMPVLFRGHGLGVSLHPLQRQGSVTINSHAIAPVVGFASGAGWQGAAPAGPMDHTWPPVLNAAGGPRDPRFMV